MQGDEEFERRRRLYRQVIPPPSTAGSSSTPAPLTSRGALEGAIAAAAANDWRALQALSCREPGLVLGAFLGTQLRLPWHTPPHK